ncbi:MAG: protein kinase [Deltaproteobacteria bacterium]|nr:protein kinase [Deltaproteobacteria bacterium]
MATVGEIIGGKYRLDRLLGEGGMGAVYAAENLNTGRRVAVKVLHSQWMQRPEVAQRFVREARATTAIAHPNIVEVLDLDAAHGITYIVQEFLEGETLEAHLAAQPGRRLGATEALAIVVPVMGALVAAHARGIVHRDLKPANLFLVRSRSGDVVPKVIDFGIAKDTAASEGATHRTQEGSAIGTPSYMSPEQVSGQTDVDAQTDVWSLGVVLYEMLTGRLPFESPNVNVLMAKILMESPTPIDRHCPDCPADLREIIATALRRERTERFGSMRAMMSAVLECGSSPPASASLPPTNSLRAMTRPPAGPVAPLVEPTHFEEAATRPVHWMAAPPETLPLPTPTSNPWSLSRPPPDTMLALTRPVTHPGAAPKRSRWGLVALGGFVALLVGAGLWAQRGNGTTPTAPIAVPVTAVRSASAGVAVAAPAPPTPPLPAVVASAPQPVPTVAALARTATPRPAALTPGARVTHPAPTVRTARPHLARPGQTAPQGRLLPMPSFEPRRPAPNSTPHLSADEM